VLLWLEEKIESPQLNQQKGDTSQLWIGERRDDMAVVVE